MVITNKQSQASPSKTFKAIEKYQWIKTPNIPVPIHYSLKSKPKIGDMVNGTPANPGQMTTLMLPLYPNGSVKYKALVGVDVASVNSFGFDSSRKYQADGLYEENIRVNEVLHNDDATPSDNSGGSSSSLTDIIDSSAGAVGALSGLITALKGNKTSANPSAGNPSPTIYNPTAATPAKKSGLSTGAMIGIVAGGLAVLGLLIWGMTKK